MKVLHDSKSLAVRRCRLAIACMAVASIFVNICYVNHSILNIDIVPSTGLTRPVACSRDGVGINFHCGCSRLFFRRIIVNGAYLYMAGSALHFQIQRWKPVMLHFGSTLDAIRMAEEAILDGPCVAVGF